MIYEENLLWKTSSLHIFQQWKEKWKNIQHFFNKIKIVEKCGKLHIGVETIAFS